MKLAFCWCLVFSMSQNVVVVQKTYGKAKHILYIVNNLPENTKSFSTLDIPSMSVALAPNSLVPTEDLIFFKAGLT